MTCFSDLGIVLYHEIMRLGLDYNRIDILFDRYFDDSLKEGTRKSWGTGGILMFDDDTDIPKDMIDNILRNSQNKYNLNEFLSKKIIDLHQRTNNMVATYKDTVLCSTSIDSHDILITQSIRRSLPATDSAYFALHISSVQEDCCTDSWYWCSNFSHVIWESILWPLYRC